MTIRYDEGAKNVLGGELVPWSLDPVTGFFRNGCCETGPHDTGMHTVCAVTISRAGRWEDAIRRTAYCA